MLKELIDLVESIEFDVYVGLCSSTKLMRKALDEHPEVMKLAELCKDRAVAIFILGHMLDLTTRQFDTQYRNPLDSAITTYLYCLTTSCPDLLKAATLTAHMARGCFWVQRYISTYLIG